MEQAGSLNSTQSRSMQDLRHTVGAWVDSQRIQTFVVLTILFNSAVLGLETSASIMSEWGSILIALDRICLSIFVLELLAKGFAHRLGFFKSPWNVFDLSVILVALIPGSGPWAVLRTLRVLRVLRLMTVLPALRKVVQAFLHSIPGLSGVAAIMAIFFYTAAVLGTKLFGQEFPDWFGSIGKSLYTLFQIMTLESWSMGIVRPVMEKFPFAWMFFVPFIIIATFTILNLFIGIIVSTMQELSIPEKKQPPNEELRDVITRIREDLQTLETNLAEKSQ
ncbi:MAG: ion transporter [Bdellovibrionales bacterium]